MRLSEDNPNAPNDSLPPLSSGGEGQPAAGLLALPAIPGYEVVGLLAEGGMGAVYEAWQVQPHRRVAIKLLRHGLMSPTLLRRFELEVEILGRIEHPAITRLYEAGTVKLGGSRVPYFAMEFVEGLPIVEYAEKSQLSIGERVRLFQRVVDGVHVAHQKGVIHRDLKPANVLVNSEGQPKILDFGVARIEQADVQITIAPQDGGGLLGTLPYMSPEQVAGRFDEVDVRSDVYSLGIMAFELLSGERPYRIEGRAWHEIARQVESQEPLRLGRLDQRLRGDLEAIVGKAIEKERDRRYASASALSDDLQRYLDSRPIEARPPSVGYQASKFVRRHKVLVSMGGLVVAALALGLALASIGLVRARRAEAEARSAEQRAVSESARAQANLQRAMDAVDQFMTVVAEGDLKQIPEAALVRQKLLQDAVAFYERFAEDNQGDGGVQTGLDWALVRLAEIKGLVGETAESRELLERKIETHERRLDAEPEHEESLRNLARGLDQQGSHWMAEGKHSNAVEAFKQAAETKGRLVELHPDNADYRRERARSLSELGMAFGAMGNISAAREAFEASQGIMEKLVRAEPGRPVFRRDLARILEENAKILIREGNRQQADRLQREAGENYRYLAHHFPDDGEFQRDYARYVGNSGEALQRMGNVAGAMQALEESNRLYHDLVKRHPENESYGRDYAITCSKLGALYARSGRQLEMRAVFESGIEAARQLAKQYAYRPDFKRDWARIQTEYGKGLRRVGIDQQAIESIGEAVRLLQELVNEHPDTVEYRLDLARTSEEWGCAYQQAGDLESAKRAFEESNRHYTILTKSGLQDPTVLVGMAYCLGNWGSVLPPEQSQQKWKEALDIWEALVQRYPHRVNYRKALEYNRQQVDNPGALRRAASAYNNKRSGPSASSGPPEQIREPESHRHSSPGPASVVGADSTVRLAARDRDALLQMAGRMAVVSGRIDHVKLNVGKNQWSFLNFSRTRKEFYGAIHHSALPDLRLKFGAGLERLPGKEIELSGILTIHKGAPSIVVTRASQVRLASEGGRSLE
jgi:tetratricopeptide (TPR) repeat protein